MLSRPTRSNFAGLTEDLEGLIYGVRTGSQVNQFVTTTKSIVNYAGQTYTNPQYIRINIEKLEYLMLRIPKKQEDIDKTL